MKLEVVNKRSQAYELRTGNTREHIERLSFICPCPNSDCNGFLNTKYICTLCKTNVCSGCKNILNDDEEHKCNNDDVMSVDYIMRTTKPCPKCGTRIYRPGGCDHMWCTKKDCNTGFSWSRGKIIRNSINTNPFYYEWRSRNHMQELPPVEEIDACELTITDILNRLGSVRHYNVSRLAQKIHHLHEITIPSLRCDRITKNRDLGVKFLKGIIDEKQFTSILKARRKKTEIDTEVSNIIETYVECCIDLFRNFLNNQSLSLLSSIIENIQNITKILQDQINTVFKVYKSKRTFSLPNINMSLS